MLESIDTEQRLTELEHALARRFASPSTAATHVADSGGLAINVSWISASSDMSILDARCALAIEFGSHVFARYAALNTAARLRFQAQLCDAASATVHQQRTVHGAGQCNASLTVDQRMLDAAAQAV